MDVAPAISYYTSAPSSPTRLTDMYCRFDELLIAAGANRNISPATVPFAWEEKPSVPKTPTSLFEDDFSFDVSCEIGSDLVPAEDLFQGGVIKVQENKIGRERGRERGFSSSRLPSRSRRARSLSPLGVLDYQREQKPSTSASACSSENVSRRWRFKDLFLFRSASDGRAMDKDPLKKYSCESGSTSKRRGRVSAHELHYNLNRANLNDMKKKTYLPYKHGILGGLSLNY
ncbi:hypothetical protein L1987_48348 [Smallanthus sonchifolius]|uniref:Uncharacterized protein n=1 Tax=Smallanthus sonchifolius TaxID=185202 RepID=A0ACB9FR31_9ASTR|nr:hypothetical protein L1987_48348 [Smallanthus sonchifolius]